MPINTITLNPGVNSEYTPSLNESAYQSTNLIRFSPSGLAQKIGGWTKFYPTPINSTVSCMHAWEDLSGVLHLAIGATEQLSVITSNVLSDITPETIQSSVTPDFSTTAGDDLVQITDATLYTNPYDVVVINTQVSVGGIVLLGPYSISHTSTDTTYDIAAADDAITTVADGGAVPVFTTTNALSSVSVLLDNHGLSVGSTFPVNIATTVGGLTLSGFYTVSSVQDANNFTIISTSTATSSQTVAMNGGDVSFTYYVANGPNLVGSGYGDYGYGTGPYGEGPTPSPAGGTPITAIDWTLDHYGGFLVACPANGPIFLWNPQSGLNTAQIIAQAPVKSTGIFVSMSAEIIVAYGSSVLGIQDPLLINWCTAGDYTQWTATVSNLAGSFRLSRGSRIVGGLQGPQYALIWTDLHLWSMTFIGSPDVFSFTELAAGCGLAGKFAAGVLGTTVYWMSYTPPETPGLAVGSGQFYALPSGGSVTPVPCSVWDFIFDTVDLNNIYKIQCCVNSTFGEISWFFPIKGGNGENAAYVKFTPQFSCWDYGYLGRSAWIDQTVFGPPIGADATSNYIYQHETSNDADGAAMGENFTTGYFALSNGQDQVFCDQVMPDMKFGKMGAGQTAVVDLTFNYSDYATGSIVYATPTYTMSSSGPQYLNPRFRARLASLTVGNSSVGSWWRLGGLRMRTASDGRL